MQEAWFGTPLHSRVLQIVDNPPPQNKRFHGAFTGGFSAGYHNTIGSREGWTPSLFISSRSNRAAPISQTIDDFGDDDDFRASRLTRAPRYDSQTKYKSLSIGEKLLACEGWSHGMAIGLKKIDRDAHKLRMRNTSGQTEDLTTYFTALNLYETKAAAILKNQQKTRDLLNSYVVQPLETGIGYNAKNLSQLIEGNNSGQEQFQQEYYHSNRLKFSQSRMPSKQQLDSARERIDPSKNLVAYLDPLAYDQIDCFQDQSDETYHQYLDISDSETHQDSHPEVPRENRQQSAIDRRPVLDGFRLPPSHSSVLFPEPSLESWTLKPPDDYKGHIPDAKYDYVVDETVATFLEDYVSSLPSKRNPREEAKQKQESEPSRSTAPLWKNPSLADRNAVLGYLFPKHRFTSGKSNAFVAEAKQQIPESNCRSVTNWRPDPLLCKRFEVPDPFRIETFVAPEKVPQSNSWQELELKMADITHITGEPMIEESSATRSTFDMVDSLPIPPPTDELFASLPSANLLKALFGNNQES